MWQPAKGPSRVDQILGLGGGFRGRAGLTGFVHVVVGNYRVDARRDVAVVFFVSSDLLLARVKTTYCGVAAVGWRFMFVFAMSSVLCHEASQDRAPLATGLL